MQCNDLEALLSEHPLAELTADQRAEVAAHVEACQACREKWGLDQQSQAFHEAARPLHGEGSVKNGVLARLSGEGKPTAPQEGTAGPVKLKRLGGFEILGRIGKGGMGTVLKARQVSLNRTVALKILPKSLAQNEDFVKRFIREARSAAMLHHPNIVQAIDVGLAEGYYYFAMECVDGEGLDAILRREGPLEQTRAVQVMEQVCSALVAAHEGGIVHRDIKPANIMLDSKGEARVTDFGLAKRTEGDVAITADGQTVGTPAYVSPEMAKGGESDGRSDLYSLGATFFHLLAGRTPFEGKNFSEILIKQVNEPPPPLASLAPRVDRRLCHIIDRLLRKNPDARYPTAKALLDDLEGLGKLQTVAQAARAEARAGIAEAPTLPLTSGRRLEREAVRARLERQPAHGKRTALLVAGGLLLAAIAGFLLLRPGPETPPSQAKNPPLSSSVPAVTQPIETPKPTPKPVSPEVPSVKKQPPIEPKEPAKKQPIPEPPAPKLGEWVNLFDGKTLDGWRVAEGGGFADHGPVKAEDGRIALAAGVGATGIRWRGEFPTTGYEIALEAMRTSGSEDFGNLAFPIGASYCELGIGAWGGTLVGLLSVDGQLAVDRAAPRRMDFESRRWYAIRLRVTEQRVEAWVDDEKLVDTPRTGHTFQSSNVQEAGFFIYSWRSAAEVRNIRLRRLGTGAPPEVKVPVLATVSFTAPSESKGLVVVSEGDGQFTTAEREGKPALYQEQRNFLYFRAADDFAKLFQADSGRTALVTITLLDTAPCLVDINYDSHIENPGEPEEATIWRVAPGQNLRGTGQWVQVKFELPGARFGHRQNNGADFRLYRSVPLPVHQVTVAAIEEDRPPNVPAQLEKGLAAAFYAGQNHDRFVVARPASCVRFNWGDGAPAPNVPADGFSTRLVGWLYIHEAGEYTFRFRRDDGARLYLDGKLTIDEWTESHGLGDPASVRLGAGWHRLWVEHMDVNHDAYIHLCWRWGETERLVPPALLYCEREMLERIRRDPTQDPFAGLTPQTPAKAPDERGETAPPPKETAADASLAAYAKKSDEVWALFKQRKYADADKLLASLAADPPKALNLPRVSIPREVIAGPLAADQEAAGLLKEFWAAVEKGLAAKAGQFLSFKGAASGTLIAVQDGTATVKTREGDKPRRVQDLLAKQALAHAALKDDPHSYLLKGVFGLAEGDDLPKAKAAFDRAGDEANVARYKERLAVLAPPKVTTVPEATPKVEPGPTERWVVYKDWPFDAAEAVRRQKATAKALGVKVEEDIDLGKGVKMAFVLISAGEFLMGSPPTTSPEKLAAAYGGGPNEYEGEFPQHRVKISRPFWMAKHEVTQEQYMAILLTNPSANKDKPRNPVEQVDWAQAHGFAKVLSEKLGKTIRLPTEAEWEYACRAGTATEFYFGNEAAKVADFGWVGGGSTQSVGMKKANAWGLFDMAGNVWEWVEDWHGKYEGGAQTDPKGAPACGRRVLRGGSWNNTPRDHRSAYRLANEPGYRYNIVGFRVVLVPGPR